jgi:hypothetical protein
MEVHGNSLENKQTDIRTASTRTALLKDIETIRVESLEASMNRSETEAAHPERSHTVTPAAFILVLGASKPLLSIHIVAETGGKPLTTDNLVKTIFFYFHDEDTADRVAKALVHAVELCGGGNKDPSNGVIA